MIRGDGAIRDGARDGGATTRDGTADSIAEDRSFSSSSSSPPPPSSSPSSPSFPSSPASPSPSPRRLSPPSSSFFLLSFSFFFFLQNFGDDSSVKLMLPHVNLTPVLLWPLFLFCLLWGLSFWLGVLLWLRWVERYSPIAKLSQERPSKRHYSTGHHRLVRIVCFVLRFHDYNGRFEM